MQEKNIVKSKRTNHRNNLIAFIFPIFIFLMGICFSLYFNFIAYSFSPEYVNPSYHLSSIIVFFFGLISFFVYFILRRRDTTAAQLRHHIKELEESNAQLKQLMDDQMKFTTIVSHELKTPLNAIKTAIDIVLRDTTATLSAQLRNFLVKANNNVDRQLRLISDILNISKLESGQQSLQVKPTNINDLIRDAVEMQISVAQSKGLYLKTDLQESLPLVEINEDEIYRVVSNLIGNALKFTKSGGITITNRANGEGNYVEVCVKDTGQGIKREDLPKVFEKFYQLKPGDDAKKGGVGLGLAICKEIITHHKGKIWVESEIGKGSSFYFKVRIKYNEALLG